jgi:hypothetical protein
VRRLAADRNRLGKAGDRLTHWRKIPAKPGRLCRCSGINPADPQQLPDYIDALKAMTARAREASTKQQRKALEAEIAAYEPSLPR